MHWFIYLFFLSSFLPYEIPITFLSLLSHSGFHLSEKFNSFTHPLPILVTKEIQRTRGWEKLVESGDARSFFLFLKQFLSVSHHGCREHPVTSAFSHQVSVSQCEYKFVRGFQGICCGLSYRTNHSFAGFQRAFENHTGSMCMN